MALRTNYVTGEPNPADAINATNADVNRFAPRTTVRAVGVGETVLNVMDFGAVGDGTTDDTAAIAAAVATANSSSKVKAIYFPGGSTFLTGSGHVFTSPVRVFGDSPDASNIKVKDASTGDVFTFNARSSAIERLYIDGNKDNVASGDTVVFNAGYPIARSLLLVNSAGTGIRVGKTTRAILARISQVMTRASRDYGLWVQQDSTDGQWSDLDVGTAGLSGIRVESSAQNMSNVHAWGCGTRKVASDASGFLFTASGQIMSTCQAETNWEDGFTFRDNDQNGASLSACKSWANGWSGFHFHRYNRSEMAGCKAYDNGMRNPAGADTAPQYSGIWNYESTHLAVTGTRTYDRAVARDVTTFTPTLSKGAVVTQVYDYVEDRDVANSGTIPHSGSFTGNSFLRDGGVVFLGNGSTVEGNRVFNGNPPSVAISGNSIPLRSNHKVVKVTGTGTLSTIPAGLIGGIVTLTFESTPTVTETDNVDLVGGAFAAVAGRQITLQYNGTKWVELSRV